MNAKLLKLSNIIFMSAVIVLIVPQFAYAQLGHSMVLDHPEPFAEDFFGHGLDTGDRNCDGQTDIIVGAPGYDFWDRENSGAVFIFDGPDFEQHSVIDNISDKSDRMGSFIKAVDLDNDGCSEILAVASSKSVNDIDGAGSVYIINKENEVVIFNSPDIQSENFGTWIDSAFIVEDNIRKQFLFIGAPKTVKPYNKLHVTAGAVYIFEVINGQIVPRSVIYNPVQNTLNAANGHFGGRLKTFVDKSGDLLALGVGAMGNPNNQAKYSTHGADKSAGNIFIYKTQTVLDSAQRNVRPDIEISNPLHKLEVDFNQNPGDGARFPMHLEGMVDDRGRLVVLAGTPRQNTPGLRGEVVHNAGAIYAFEVNLETKKVNLLKTIMQNDVPEITEQTPDLYFGYRAIAADIDGDGVKEIGGVSLRAPNGMNSPVRLVHSYKDINDSAVMLSFPDAFEYPASDFYPVGYAVSKANLSSQPEFVVFGSTKRDVNGTHYAGGLIIQSFTQGPEIQQNGLGPLGIIGDGALLNRI